MKKCIQVKKPVSCVDFLLEEGEILSPECLGIGTEYKSRMAVQRSSWSVSMMSGKSSDD